MSILSVRNVTKRFGALLALDDVCVDFEVGEIHAVLGENGAGKSTLMNVMSGFSKPDKGSVLLNGDPIPLGKAFACKRLGIEMIHQHFTLVPGFTVEENFALSRLDRLTSIADVTELAQPALETSKALGWPMDMSAKTGQLSVGIQQRIEILKAVGGNASVLIFDEPTAVLSPDEVEDLFRVLRRLKAEGKCVILIAHKLTEVLSIADRITVLRRGKQVVSAERSELDSSSLAHWMVGEMPVRPYRNAPKPLNIGLRVDNLTVLGDRGETAVDNISFEINKGEILGFGGVDGNGQVELAECMAQVRPGKTGVQTWCGSVFTAIEPMIGYVPQDRQIDGLALSMSISDNMLVSGLDRNALWSGPFVKAKSVSDWVNSLIKRYSIKVEGQMDLAGSLSGGNQQKVVVSRTLDNHPSLLIVVNPGRGLDIKATEYVHEVLLAARDAGAAVALISTDLEELYKLSDRTVFMVNGQLVKDSGARSMVGGDR